jgi:hypothetical protein
MLAKIWISDWIRTVFFYARMYRAPLGDPGQLRVYFASSFSPCLGLKQCVAFILSPPQKSLFTLCTVSNFKVAKSLTTYFSLLNGSRRPLVKINILHRSTLVATTHNHCYTAPTRNTTTLTNTQHPTSGITHRLDTDITRDLDKQIPQAASKTGHPDISHSQDTHLDTPFFFRHAMV